MPTLHLALIRSYVPDPALDWDALDPTAKSWTRYADPDVEAEYHRFATRDIGSVISPYFYAAGTILYPILMPEAYMPTVLWIHLSGGIINITLCILDVFVLWTRDTLDRRWITVRRVANFWAVLHCVMATSFVLPVFTAKCHRAPIVFDLADAIPYMNPSPDNYTHDCIDVVWYMIFSLAFPFIGNREHPLLAAGLPSALALGLFYLGYHLGADEDLRSAGETTGELFVKLGFYLLLFAFAAGVATLRFVRLRAQFEATVASVKQARVTEQRREEADALLCAMLPASALDRLLQGERVVDWTPSASVLFSDMKGFTAWSATRTAQTVATMLNTLCTSFDAVAAEVGVEKVKTIGDAYWAVCGLPEEDLDHATVLTRFGVIMHAIVARETRARAAEWGDVQLRIGVNSGPVTAAVFGATRLTYEVCGLTSEIAALCEQAGAGGRVCVGPTTAQQLPESVATEPHVTIAAPEDSVTPAQHRHHAANAELELRLLAPSAYAADIACFTIPDATAHGVVVPDDAVVKSLEQSGGRVQLAQLRDLSFHRSKARLSIPGFDREATRAVINYQRQQFLKQRASRREELAAQEETLEELEARLSTRAYQWVLLGFADAETEREFQAFVLSAAYDLRRFTRAQLAAFVAYQLVMALTQSQSEVPAVSIALLSVALAIVVGLAGATVPGPESTPLPAKVDAVLVFTAWVADTAGCVLIPHSIVGNSPIYVFVMFALVTAFGVTNVPSFTLFISNILFAHLTLIPQWSRLTFIGDTTFVFLCSVLSGIAAVVSEKLYRKEFMERRVREFNQGLQARREQEQRVLLESVVPPHVIPPLQRWMLAGMRVEETIRRTYASAAVGFLKLIPPDDVFAASRSTVNAPAATVAPPKPTFDASTPKSDTDRSFIADLDVDGTMVLRGAAAAEHAQMWMFDAHVAVDSVLRLFASFDKIKTIGDSVMVAGDFRRRSSHAADASVEMDASASTPQLLGAGSQRAGPVSRAALDMLLAVTLLLTPPEGAEWGAQRVAAGFNVGEVLGTVQGTSRLAFDVFGDCVNVASRVLSSSLSAHPAAATAEGPPCVAMSSAFHDAVRAAMAEGGGGSAVHVTADSPSPAVFGLSDDRESTSAPRSDEARTLRIVQEPEMGAAVERAAKGKGTIAVHDVVRLPVVAID